MPARVATALKEHFQRSPYTGTGADDLAFCQLGTPNEQAEPPPGAEAVGEQEIDDRDGRTPEPG
jgi:hypothetical protein